MAVEGLATAFAVAQALGQAVGFAEDLGLFGGDEGRGSQDPRDPNYHGEHWGRELAFRQRNCNTFAAPTGRVRDVEAPARIRALDAMGARTHRIRQLFPNLPAECTSTATFFGVGPVPADVPYRHGWAQFALGPSPFQQAARQLGISEADLFQRIIGQPAQAPPTVQQGDDMSVGAAIGDFLSVAGDIVDAYRGHGGGYTTSPPPMGGLGPIFQTAPGGSTIFDLPAVDIVPQGHRSHTPFARSLTPRTVGMAKEVQVQGPNGKTHVYRNKGRALLYADDLAAVKRVRRAAAQANRACGTRRTTRRGRR